MYNIDKIINIKFLANYLRTETELLELFCSDNREIIVFPNEEFEKNNKKGIHIISLPKNYGLENKIDKVYYSKLEIPKKNKTLGYRTVYKLENLFATNILKHLNSELKIFYKPLDCVHGFVAKRNILTNAKNHLAKKVIVSIDIKNFFESIQIEHVKNAFIKLGFNNSISDILSKICTLNNVLIQGLTTSPIIANIVCQELDNEINEFCRLNNWVYTRYVDDINISSNSEIRNIDEIEKIILKYNFSLNHKKTKKFFRGEKQYVTGLSVFDDKTPRLPRHIKRTIRLHLHYMQKNGIKEHFDKIKLDLNNPKKYLISPINEQSFVCKIFGWIDYVNSVEPILAKKYNRKLFEIIENEIKNAMEEEEGLEDRINFMDDINKRIKQYKKNPPNIC